MVEDLYDGNEFRSKVLDEDLLGFNSVVYWKRMRQRSGLGDGKELVEDQGGQKRENEFGTGGGSYGRSQDDTNPSGLSTGVHPS